MARTHPGMLSISLPADDLDRDVAFWETVLGTPRAAVLSWGENSGSAFFELAGGVRLIVTAPSPREGRAEWLGLEFETGDPQSTHARLAALGVAVSEVYDTDGGSRAIVVTTPSGQKFRMGTRWPLPAIDADFSRTTPKERGLS